MLKNLPPAHPSNSAKAKCGDIFCHSSKDFTIFCSFCNLKSFTFDDFIFHIQRVHFENNLLKAETINNKCNRFMDLKVKKEALAQAEMKGLWDNLEESYNDGDDIDNADSYEFSSYDEEPVMVLRKSGKNIHTGHKKRKCYIKNERKDDSSDDEFNSQQTLNHHGGDIENTTRDKSATLLQYEKRTLLSKKKERIEHSCAECEQIFPHLKYLDRHVFEFHNGYKCSLCDKRFRLRHHLRGHAKTHITEKCFKCPVEDCGKIFADEEYLKRHHEVHTMECTFICDFGNCGKAFQTKRRLTIHTYTHRKPKKLVCDACGYSCRANITLRIHQRVHTGEKPFGCEVCEKRFVSKTAVTEHMISHSNIRPHICQICNASFANPRVLQRHIFIHSDERTFKCKLCNSAFKQARGLDGHMRRLHRPPKPSSVTV